jgi:hypothetical protein
VSLGGFGHFGDLPIEVGMNSTDGWLWFIAAMSKIILDFVEKRKARRGNGEPTS